MKGVRSINGKLVSIVLDKLHICTMKDVKAITGKLVPIVLDELHIRYIPMARLERWYGKDMRLIASPHVEMLKMYLEHGLDWDKMMASRYAEERRARRVEFKQEKWSEEWIRKHIRIRIETYESLKKMGFKPRGEPIQVLSTPFWRTRFGLTDEDIQGTEIWNGAGRCAAAYVLGWRKIPGMWVVDAFPNTNKCEQIECKFK